MKSSWILFSFTLLSIATSASESRSKVEKSTERPFRPSVAASAYFDPVGTWSSVGLSFGAGFAKYNLEGLTQSLQGVSFGPSAFVRIGNDNVAVALSGGPSVLVGTDHYSALILGASSSSEVSVFPSVTLLGSRPWLLTAGFRSTWNHASLISPIQAATQFILTEDAAASSSYLQRIFTRTHETVISALWNGHPYVTLQAQLSHRFTAVGASRPQSVNLAFRPTFKLNPAQVPIGIAPFIAGSPWRSEANSSWYYGVGISERLRENRSIGVEVTQSAGAADSLGLGLHLSFSY